MIERLKHTLIENDHPIGVKKHSNWKLPKEGHTYGLPGKTDKEGADISKKKI